MNKSEDNTISPVALEGPELHPWDQSPAVDELQELLSAHGYYLRVDGDFGAKTEAAVATFQRQQGLKVDGTVGPQTWAALKSTVQPASRLLRQGHTGADVYQLQWLLQICGYDLCRDGIFGIKTHQVVLAFQKRHKLRPDGVIDRTTWWLLRGSSQPLPPPQSPSTDYLRSFGWY